MAMPGLALTENSINKAERNVDGRRFIVPPRLAILQHHVRGRRRALLAGLLPMNRRRAPPRRLGRQLRSPARDHHQRYGLLTQYEMYIYIDVWEQA
jgi:hypothetical protein